MGVDRMRQRILPTLTATSLSLALNLVCGFSLATISFERTYGGGGMDHSHSLQQTHDGGYILAGCTNSFGAGLQDIYLVKTDSLGDTLWTRTYGDSNQEFGFCVQQTHDKGYIVTGLTVPDSGSEDLYLIKTDSLGDSAWARTYGGDNYDIGISVQQTLDLGYVVGGLTYSFGADLGNMYVVRTDSLGDTLWTRNHGGSRRYFGRSIQETQDGGFVLGGYTGPFGGPYDMCLVKLDSLGDTLWTRTYGGINGEFGYSVQQTLDGGYVIAGNTASFGAGAYDIYLVKTDSLGVTVWTRTYGGSGEEDRECHVQQTTDGGYIIAGSTTSFGAGSRDLYLIKTDSLGDTVWTRTYGGSSDDRGLYVQQTYDGGYAVSGGTESSGAGEEDAYLVKTDGYGLTGTVRDAAVVEINLPPDTVFVDSTYGVVATVRNFGNVAMTFDVVATIDGYTDTVQILDIDPDLSTQAVFGEWHVPSTDSTVYNMTVCAYAVGDADTTNDCMQKSIFAYSPVGVQERHSQPVAVDFGLTGNHPNPFRHSTMISYSLARTAGVTLAIYDITGRLVETLVNKTQQPGIHHARWNRMTSSSGVYFCRLKAYPELAEGQSPELAEGQSGEPVEPQSRRAEEFMETRKMVLLD